jgi:hypothetical protein
VVYELAPAVAAREARERERRESGIAERVARVREQPELVRERLAEAQSRKRTSTNGRTAALRSTSVWEFA